jgi:hypothetical protein
VRPWHKCTALTHKDGDFVQGGAEVCVAVCGVGGGRALVADVEAVLRYTSGLINAVARVIQIVRLSRIVVVLASRERKGGLRPELKQRPAHIMFSLCAC